MTERLVIIGSGLAAWTAALYAARADLTPIVFEGAICEANQIAATLPYGQLMYADAVDDFPGFPEGILGQELVLRARDQAMRFGARAVTEDVVELALAARPFHVLDSSGARHQARALIVATGARRRPWQFGFVNFGVSLDSVSDCALPRMRDRPVAIIGGGDQAMTTALHMTRFASIVYVIHRGAQFRAKRMYVQHATRHPKVRLLLDRNVVGVEGDETNGVTGLRLRHAADEHDSCERLPVSGIFPCTGYVPNTEFLGGQLTLNPAGYVQLAGPPTSATSVPGVFAAGEVADPLYRQAVTAAASGCQAALDVQRWLEHETRGVGAG